MKTKIIIQARMNSSRLPGKVLKKIHNIPITELIVKRLTKSKQKTDILVATSNDYRNVELINFIKKKNINDILEHPTSFLPFGRLN